MHQKWPESYAFLSSFYLSVTNMFCLQNYFCFNNSSKARRNIIIQDLQHFLTLGGREQVLILTIHADLWPFRCII